MNCPLLQFLECNFQPLRPLQFQSMPGCVTSLLEVEEVMQLKSISCHGEENGLRCFQVSVENKHIRSQQKENGSNGHMIPNHLQFLVLYLLSMRTSPNPGYSQSCRIDD